MAPSRDGPVRVRVHRGADAPRARVEAGHGLRMAEQEVPLRVQPIEQAPDDARLAGGVEIDEDVPAEDQIEAARERERLRVQVEPLETHPRPDEWALLHAPLLGAAAPEHEGLEIGARD